MFEKNINSRNYRRQILIEKLKINLKFTYSLDNFPNFKELFSS